MRVLDAAGVPYMATGSLVSSLQGEPRATHDIDLVVSITSEAAGALLAAFPAPDYYLDQHAVVDALTRRDMFNLLDVVGGDKVDFWMLTDDAYDQARFARRQREELGDVTIYVSAPEDTILQKLRWSKMSGGSDKQFGDAIRVYEIQFGRLDLNYILHWVGVLGVEDSWLRLQRAARPL